MFKWNLQNTRSVLFHLLFWTSVWFFYLYFFSYSSDNTTFAFGFSSFLLPVTMATSYFFVYFLIQRFLLSRRYFLFTLYSLYTLIVSAYLVVLTTLLSFVYFSILKVENIPPMSRNFMFVLILEYLVVAIISFLHLLNHNFENLKRNKELQNTILETKLQSREQELKYLKRQIHPHFLFNTLNTIYGFALKQSPATPEIILKLSNLLDYILYEAGKTHVSLKNEILHIEEYIELEKLRFQDSLQVDFQYNETDENIQIAPMLFIPFVENAFKHGSFIDGVLKISMQLNTSDKGLIFSIQNTVRNEKKTAKHGGLGLENIQKRLELHYPKQFNLEIENTESIFSVMLSLQQIKKD